MRKFKVGDKVLISGDASDFTDHLDGLIGTVLDVYDDDCYVLVDARHWFIWNYNMTLVEDDLK